MKMPALVINLEDYMFRAIVNGQVKDIYIPADDFWAKRFFAEGHKQFAIVNGCPSVNNKLNTVVLPLVQPWRTGIISEQFGEDVTYVFVVFVASPPLPVYYDYQIHVVPKRPPRANPESTPPIQP